MIFVVAAGCQWLADRTPCIRSAAGRCCVSQNLLWAIQHTHTYRSCLSRCVQHSSCVLSLHTYLHMPLLALSNYCWFLFRTAPCCYCTAARCALWGPVQVLRLPQCGPGRQLAAAKPAYAAAYRHAAHLWRRPAAAHAARSSCLSFLLAAGSDPASCVHWCRYSQRFSQHGFSTGTT